MLLCIARTGRYDRSTKMLYTIVRTQSAREQAITVGYRKNVVARHTISRQAACHALAPDANVFSCVTHNSGITCRTAGGMHAYDLALRCGLQAKGIVVTKVLLCREGQFLNVLDGLDVIGTNVHLLQLVAVERDIVIHVLHDFVKSLTLARAHLVATHTFFVRIPNHAFCVANGLIPRKNTTKSTNSIKLL